MSEGELPVNLDRATAPRAVRSPGRRVLEWFWLGSTLPEKTTALPEPGERARVFAERARLAASVGQSVLTPVEPYDTPTDAIACELFRQSAYWSLCAFNVSAELSSETSDESIWVGLGAHSLTQASVSAERAESVRAALRGGSFVYFAEQPARDQVLLRRELGKLAETLLHKVDERRETSRAIYWRRAWRLGLLVLVSFGVVQGLAWAHEARELRNDLTFGKPWRTSSVFGGSVCTSPEQACPENTDYFFHTAEEKNPFIEWDLGSEQSVSTVEVDNRKDCCTDRAAPLVIQVSSDGKKWHEVARRDDAFSTWRASFDPVKARWVRLRVPKKTYLHLFRVRIFS